MATTAPIPASGKLRRLPDGVLRRLLRLPPEHAALLDGSPETSALLESLVGHDLPAEAARLLGYALPEREAVWWACMCVRNTAAVPQPGPEQAALAAVEEWVRTPNEATRQVLRQAAAAAGDTAAAWAARAANASLPSPLLHTRVGRRVETAIARAAGYGAAGQATKRLERFIASGRDIAAGGAGRLPPGTG